VWVKVSGWITAVAMLVASGYYVLEFWVLRDSSKRIPRTPITGLDALIGSEAEVVEAFTRRETGHPLFGQVRAGGELWKAELTADPARPAVVGDRVRIVGVAGLLLKVTC
jgi:membrane protein implicated in regulation of membrane protease activity